MIELIGVVAGFIGIIAAAFVLEAIVGTIETRLRGRKRK